MTAEIGHQGREGIVGVARDQLRDLCVVANVAQQPFPPSRAALVGQCSIFRVGTGIDPLFQALAARPFERRLRSEEHTSELQSLMRISYAVFCLTQKTQKK